MKNIIITGSTRGIGFAMASAFLKQGCKVVISGTSEASVEKALEKLIQYKEQIIGVACNVTDHRALQNLWDRGHKAWGRVDIWINNAGINQPDRPLWEIGTQELRQVLATNIEGMIAGSSVAVQGMLIQGFGAIYNMEGFGSTGEHRFGLNLYGTTKAALSYYTRGLIQETQKTPVSVNLLSPGMVLTDFLLKPLETEPEKAEGTKKIFNILADKPETVGTFLARKILSNKKRGVRIAWLTPGKIFFRFFSSIFVKRKLI